MLIKQQTLLTSANWRPMLPIVTPPEKNTQGSHDLTYKKSGSVYLKTDNTKFYDQNNLYVNQYM